MSVLVTVRRRARPGQAEALFEAAAALLAHPPRRVAARTASLFQSRADPAVMLYLAEWHDYRDYQEARAAHQGHLGSYCAAPPEIRYYHLLHYYDIVSMRATAVGGLLITAPPQAAAAVRAGLLDQDRSAVLRWPGFVSRLVAQDAQNPGHLLVVFRWRTPSEQMQAVWEPASACDAELQALGARVEHFAGYVRAELWVDPAGGRHVEQMRPAPAEG